MGDFNLILHRDEKCGGHWNEIYQSILSDQWFHLQLQDLGCSCSPFTWTNLQFDNNFVQEWLDIAIATSSWRSEFPKSHVTHQPPWGSDHLLILIHTSYSELPFAKPFRFRCFWAGDIQFNDVLRKAWSVHQAIGALLPFSYLPNSVVSNLHSRLGTNSGLAFFKTT